MRVTPFANICICLTSILLGIGCNTGTASITEPAASVTNSKKLTVEAFGCEGVDPEETPGELVCWINSDNRMRPPLRATLTRHESDEGAWLEASVENNEESHPYKATATRPLPGQSPARFDNLFVEMPSNSPAGKFDSAIIYSGEPDFDEVDAPHYRVSAYLENHGQSDIEAFDFGVQCVLRCDGKGETPIVDPVIDVTVPLEERPEVAVQCRAWGAGYGSVEMPAITTDNLLVPATWSDRPVLLGKNPLHADPAVLEVLKAYQVDMAWVHGMAPSTYYAMRLEASGSVVRGAMLYSPGLLGYDAQNSKALNAPATRLQMGSRSDPRSFTIDCNLEFEAPWALKE